MQQDIVSAIFDERAQAEQAVCHLRSAGVSDSAISIVGHPDDYFASGDKSDEGHDVGDVAEGGAPGGAPCTVLGVPALAIPAIMPLAAAGGVAASAVPTVAAVASGVDTARDALVKMLEHHEVGARDASYYEERIRSGSFFISVDMRRAGVGGSAASDIFAGYGGYSESRPVVTAV
jgi:hypothetical protein